MEPRSFFLAGNRIYLCEEFLGSRDVIMKLIDSCKVTHVHQVISEEDSSRVTLVINSSSRMAMIGLKTRKWRLHCPSPEVSLKIKDILAKHCPEIQKQVSKGGQYLYVS
jgi:hypothetical protein